tara:strand:+ start:9634 stop:10572 length:939 start_codon:yes stop_codon:yes gene_type:complete
VLPNKPPEGLTSRELSELCSYDPNDEDKFLKLSKSSFMNYLMCPRQFWWNKIQLKDHRMTATPQMIRGTKVHTNLELIYDNWDGQSVLSPLIPEGREDDANENLVFLEECRIAKWGIESFKPCEYEEYRAVWDDENQVVLVGLIDAILVHPDGGLCIYELKTGNWASTKMNKTRKELCYYAHMLRLMGETRPITHFAYLAPDAANHKFMAEMCGWKDDDGKWDEDRVLTTDAGWVDSKSKREIAFGKNGKGVLVIEKVTTRSFTSFEKSLKEAVIGIKTHEWPMKWNDYFCPQWCDFSMSCETEMTGVFLDE